MRFLSEFGSCDCHSHVFGPFDRFPLSSKRTFDPPEARIEELESVWQNFGLERGVLVQGSAHGDDHNAMLAAIARQPKSRRGVALLSPEITDVALADLQQQGIRAVRFNWIHSLLGHDSRGERQRLFDAERLLQKIAPLGWHAEIHINICDLELIQELHVPPGMPVVIDHMARIDASAADWKKQLRHLLRVLEREQFWAKISGADRIAANTDDLGTAVEAIREILSASADRCVWGLDWPHVNLTRKRSDTELVNLLAHAVNNETRLRQILIINPEKLYGFGSQLVSDSTLV